MLQHAFQRKMPITLQGQRGDLAAIAAIVHIGFVVLWIIATVKAFTGVRWDIPYVGPIARKQVGEAS